jgi:murein DD-endopeptidase MepM/ murein hydrolase activator NlpD
MQQARFAIVTHFLGRLFQPTHWRRWLLALALPFVGVVTAFGIAPNTVTDSITRSMVIEDVSMPTTLLVNEPALQIYWREDRVRRGDTLPSLLSRLKIHDDGALGILAAMPEARPLYQLMPGRTLRVASNDDGELLGLEYHNGERVFHVKRDGGQFQIDDAVTRLESRIESASGEIRSSLFAATDALNLPDSVAMQMVEIFSTNIDFHKDLRKGDRFSVVYEVLTDRGEPIGAGRVLSAEFVNQGKTYNVVWFASPSTTNKNTGSYYTLDGRDIRKSFLRSPLQFSRISSGFTDRRYHPLLHSWHAHKGVDFVAPIGTKIRATADGVVDFAGVQQGYGNVVILKHHNNYSTLYAHMRAFEKGIRPGAKVQQGDFLGEVGMTGLTTGPHVHYEFRIGGMHRDPMTVEMPQAKPISAAWKPAFQQATAQMAHIMTLLRDASPASFE